MELDNIETIKRSVEAGLGVSLLPAAALTNEARARTLVARAPARGSHPPLHRRDPPTRPRAQPGQPGVPPSAAGRAGRDGGPLRPSTAGQESGGDGNAAQPRPRLKERPKWLSSASGPRPAEIRTAGEAPEVVRRLAGPSPVTLCWVYLPGAPPAPVAMPASGPIAPVPVLPAMPPSNLGGGKPPAAGAAHAAADGRRLRRRGREHLLRADEVVQDAPAPAELVEVADHAGREVGHIRAGEEPRQRRLLEREARPDLELGAARLARRVAPVAGVARKTMTRLGAHARHLPREEVRGVDVAALERRAFEHQRHGVLLGEDHRLVGEDEPPEPIGEVEAPIRRLCDRRRHEHAARGVEVELTELPREARARRSRSCGSARGRCRSGVPAPRCAP